MIKFFSFLCICNPMLAVYSSPIPGVDLGTFLILIFAFLLLHDKKRKIYKMPTSLSLLLTYTVVTTFLGLTGKLNSEPLNILLRLFRYIIVMVVMIGIGYPTYFNKELFLKYLHKATIIVAGYAMLQALIYLFIGIQLPGTFGPTKVDYSVDDAGASAASSVLDYFYRPTSFFYEPSHASYFMSPYLCYLLFASRDFKDKRSRNLAIFVTLGILITTSGQGLAVLTICWGIWGLRQLRRFNMKSILLLSFAIIMLVASFDIYKVVERVITPDEFNAVDARKGGYDIIKETPFSQLILGYGYGNYDQTIYHSSLAEIIICTGYVGFGLVLIMFLNFYIKGQRYQKVLVLSVLLLMAGGGVFTASYLCLFLPLLMCDNGCKVSNRIKYESRNSYIA